MINRLWLVPAAPFVSFIILALFGRMLPRRVAAFFGVGSVGLSAAVSLLIAFGFLVFPPDGHRFVQPLWTWIEAGGLTSNFSLALDPLSLIMMTVVTFIGFLIHVYSLEYMHDDPGFS